MQKKRKQKAPRLLSSEIEILEMLWREGSVTIREAQRGLGQRPGTGYSTVQTRLNRMVKKRLVNRSNESRSRYTAAIQPEEVWSEDLEVLVDQVTGGRVVPLVAHLVRDRSLSEEEVLELKQLISAAEQAAETRSRQSK